MCLKSKENTRSGMLIVYFFSASQGRGKLKYSVGYVSYNAIGRKTRNRAIATRPGGVVWDRKKGRSNYTHPSRGLRSPYPKVTHAHNVWSSCRGLGVRVRVRANLLHDADSDPPSHPHTPTHPHTRNYPGGAGSLAARRTQPCSLAVSRLTVYTVEDLYGGASLGFLGQELRPVRYEVASRPQSNHPPTAAPCLVLPSFLARGCLSWSGQRRPSSRVTISILSQSV